MKTASTAYKALTEGKDEKEKKEALKPMVDWYNSVMDLSQEKTMNVAKMLKKCVQENVERVRRNS